MALNNICRLVFIHFYGLQVTTTFLKAIASADGKFNKIRQIGVLLLSTTGTRIQMHATTVTATLVRTIAKAEWNAIKSTGRVKGILLVAITATEIHKHATRIQDTLERYKFLY